MTRPSADGLRFVVPVNSINAGPEPEVLRQGKRREECDLLEEFESRPACPSHPNLSQPRSRHDQLT